MLRVSYQDSNDRIFEMVHEKPKLLLSVRNRKLKYFGQLIRGNGKQSISLEAKFEETRKTERQRGICRVKRCFEMD